MVTDFAQNDTTSQGPPMMHRRFGMNSTKKRSALIGALILLAIAVPTTIFLSQQEQDTRQRASELPQGVSVNVTASPQESTTSCPALITFTGTITSSTAQTVKYRWMRSDDATSPVETVTFDAPGTKTVTKTWNLGINGDPVFNPYEGWMSIRIITGDIQGPTIIRTPTSAPPATLTPTPVPVVIQSSINCSTGQRTMNQVCQANGYAKAVPVGGKYAAKSYLWKQCAGASVVSCNGIECNIRDRDCTADQGADFSKASVREWGMQNPQSNGQPYDPNWIAYLEPTAWLNPAQLSNPSCDGSHNPGWTVRVSCSK